MRKILFRGKALYDGEWKEGNLFIPDLPDTPTQICIGTNVVRISYDVAPETIGQYTGLTDKNGTKIFEGDILSERPPMNQTAYIGYVAYDEELAVWRFMIKNDTKYNGVLLGSYSQSYKIIGNIHDNPELLSGDTDVLS